MERIKILIAVLFLVAAIGLLFASVRESRLADETASGLLPPDQIRTAPDWALPDAATGQVTRLSAQAKARPIVFSFWATWCEPCRMELPHLQALARKYQGRVAFYGINSNDPPRRITEFARAYHLTFPMLSDAKRDAANAYGADAIPLLVVVDRQGNARAVLSGYDTEGDEEASLSGILDAILSEK